MIISSSQNPLYKKLRSLTTTKGIKEHGQCLLSGQKITSDYCKRANPKEYFWICRADQNHPPGESKNNLTLARELFESLDLFGTHHPILCAKTLNISNQESHDLQKPTLYCSLSDPANLGAVIRSAFAFGMKQVVLTKESSHPFHPKALRSSSGYSFDMDFFTGPAIRELPSQNLMALDMNGDSLSKTILPKNLHFLIGEEGQGVPSTFSGNRVAIPIDPNVNSLNAAVAASLLLYEWQRQQEE